MPIVRVQKPSSPAAGLTRTSILHNGGPLYPAFDAPLPEAPNCQSYVDDGIPSRGFELHRRRTHVKAQVSSFRSFSRLLFGIAMGRRRVLVLAPAITRMQCMGNPYRRVKDGEGNEKEEVPLGGGEVVRKASFWSSWRRRTGGKKRGGSRGAAGAPRRRWGFRVSKLRIRMLSPAFWLKKLRDSYINMMLAIERNAPVDCSGIVTYPSYVAYPHYPGGGAWVWPTFPPPVVF